MAGEVVRSAYVHGTPDRNLGLTPAQCRRLRHKRKARRKARDTG
jgi:hypothetical protein